MKLETMVCDLCHTKWLRGDLHICPKCGLQFCITCRSQSEGDASLRRPLKCLECGYSILSTDYLSKDEYRKLRANRAAEKRSHGRNVVSGPQGSERLTGKNDSPGG